MKTKNIAIILSLLVLTACSDVKNYQIGTMNSEQKQEVLKKLNEEERKLYLGFILRLGFAEGFGKEEDKKILKEMTVSQALQDQKDWIIKREEKDRLEKIEQEKIKKEKEELNAKIEQEKKELSDKINSTISFTVIDKKNKELAFSQKYVVLGLVFENKGSKDILGIKGKIKISDIFDDEIINSSFSYDDGILAGKIAKYNPGMSINEFMAKDQKLWSTDFDKLKISIEPEIIIFKDGTRFEIRKE